MAKATTESYEEMILEVEMDPIGASGTYTSICGLKEVTVNRTANVDTDEIPDCADESAPFSIERAVRSVEVMVSANGTWAQESHSDLLTWWRSGATKNVRVKNTAVASTDIEIESGPALLTQLNNAKVKGKVVTAEIQIEFNGLPAVTNKA